MYVCIYVHGGNISKAAREDKPVCTHIFQGSAFVMFVATPLAKGKHEANLKKYGKRLHLFDEKKISFLIWVHRGGSFVASFAIYGNKIETSS